MARAVTKQLPNQVRLYRRKRNLQLREVALSAGMPDVSNLAHWEKGRKLPSLKNALKLSAIIQCPVEVLFFDLFDSLRREIREREKSLLTKSQLL